jgi:hypothetical protein
MNRTSATQTTLNHCSLASRIAAQFVLNLEESSARFPGKDRLEQFPQGAQGSRLDNRAPEGSGARQDQRLSVYF